MLLHLDLVAVGLYVDMARTQLDGLGAPSFTQLMV